MIFFGNNFVRVDNFGVGRQTLGGSAALIKARNFKKGLVVSFSSFFLFSIFLIRLFTPV